MTNAFAAQTVKVFVLAGQSNMEGKATNELFDYQANDPSTADLFAHLREGGEWVVRDDAFVRFGNRHGRLTLGYGSPDRTGIELELGTVLAGHLEEPVLLIKTAWGGHSLVKMFRSPSAGLPDDAKLQAELNRARERVAKNNAQRNRDDPMPVMADITADYGSSYRKMIAEVRGTLANLDALFPELAGHSPELAGFVWFQGWNDMRGGELEYADNLACLIDDVRQDLSAPKLPVVIGVMGQNGSSLAKGGMLAVQQAQLSVAELPRFRGTVAAVRTDVLVDKAAEQLFPTWKKNFEQWKRTGSDRAYHYFGSAIWHVRMGHAMGEAMLELIQ